jgi:urease accessory protein
MQSDHLLTLTQWLSPAYPVGAFAWSHGLEAAVAAGQVTDAPSLEDWLAVVVEHGAGRSDAILLAAAHGAPSAPALAVVAELAAALAPSAERRAETLGQGAAFAATTRAVCGLCLPDMAYPVAVGRAAALMGIPVLPVAQVWLQSVVSNLVAATQRLMPLGQTAAQGVLYRLTPLCAGVAGQAVGQGIDDIGSTAFAVDIAAMRHEVQPMRIFRS